jgi:DNA-binding NtrC family response regulator
MTPARILIVDDERSIRTLLRTLLASEGFEIQEAADGTEALDALTQDPLPDLVLLDLSMPAPQGMEVLKRLKHMAIHPKPRVIVLTANGSVGRAVEAMQLGAVDFVEKPSSPEQLLEKITRALKRKVLAQVVTPDGAAAALTYARRHLADGDLAGAEALLRAAGPLSDANPEYHYLVGLWHELSDRPDEAKVAYAKAAQVHPAAHDALNRLSRPRPA